MPLIYYVRGVIYYVRRVIYYVRGVIYNVILGPVVNEEVCDFPRGFYEF